MSMRRWRGPFVALTAVVAPFMLMNCGAGKGIPGVPGAPGSCPANIADASAIMSANFGLQGELEGKVKAALAAGANLQALAVGIEADVAAACGKLAQDLGATDIEPKEEGPGKKAEAACSAAAKALGEMKAKAFGSADAKLNIEVVPPKCSASMNAMADCAAKCDVNVKPGEAKVTCEGGEISGKCSGQCSGSCTVEAGAGCEGGCSGSCQGSCEGNFTGKCEGTCNGKCEGKDSKGKCAGTCDGKCEGNADGSCSGTCKGSCSAKCTMEGKAECKGECSGGCSVEIEEPKCSGEVKPPEMSGECKASCDAEISGKVECQPATVKITGAAGAEADAAAAAKLKAVLQADLPAVLKVALGMKGRLEGVMTSVQASIEGVQAAVTGGGDAALKVGGCFVASLKASAEASASINVSVKASASASASAGAG